MAAEAARLGCPSSPAGEDKRGSIGSSDIRHAELTRIITTGRRGSAIGTIPQKEPSKAAKEK